MFMCMFAEQISNWKLKNDASRAAAVVPSSRGNFDLYKKNGKRQISLRIISRLLVFPKI